MIQHYYTGMSTAFSRCEETRIQHKVKKTKKQKENRSYAERTRIVDKMKIKLKDYLRGKHPYVLYPHKTKLS